MPRTTPIRVLCADDHRLFREGLTLIIGQQPDMEVIGVAASAEETIQLFRQLQPDVTIMDLRMGPMTGVEAIEEIRRDAPDAKIVVVTMYGGDEDIHRATTAGAAAYVFKNAVSDELLGVVRDVHRGQRPAMSAELKARLEEHSSRPRITAREAQMLELISHGLRDKEIARAMDISEYTVYNHVRNILFKLEVKDRTAAVRVALKRGIIHIV